MKGDVNNILKRIKIVATDILPVKSRMYLYGSRARGDYNDSSDWDMIIILNKDKATREDYDKYAFPFYMLGAELKEIFSPLVYGAAQWRDMSMSPFYQNVQNDKIVIV